jgi:hypothetical protein
MKTLMATLLALLLAPMAFGSATVIGTSGTDWTINTVVVRPMYGIRAANALWGPDDAVMTSLIANLTAMKVHGVLIIGVSLQGGRTGSTGMNPPHDAEQYDCFEPWNDAGTPKARVKAECKARLAPFLEAADARGQAAQLVAFYQGQSGWLTTNVMVESALKDLGTWVEAEDYDHVIVDGCNEHGHGGFDSAPVFEAGLANANQLCTWWHEVSTRPCSVSTLGSTPYAVTGSLDYQLWHGTGGPSGGLSSTKPRMTNEIERYDSSPDGSEYEHPGEFTTGERTTIETAIINAYASNGANSYSWFWHGSWTQGVYEGQTRNGPRFVFGKDGWTAPSTGGNRTVHFVFDKMREVLGLPDPDLTTYYREDGSDTSCTGTVDAPYVPGLGPTTGLACALQTKIPSMTGGGMQ